MELKRKLIQDQQEQIQSLKASVNEIRAEKLQISSNMQKQQQLEEQCVEFKAEIQELHTEIRVMVKPSPKITCFCDGLIRHPVIWFRGCWIKVRSSKLLFCVMQDAKEQVSPLAITLEKLQHEKQDLIERRKHKQREGQEKVCNFSVSTKYLK